MITPKKCVCEEHPVIICESDGAWTYRHDCKILKKRFEGTKFESEQAAIEAWNKAGTQQLIPKKGDPIINDPLQLALEQSAQARGFQALALGLEKEGKIQRADSMGIIASFKWARHDFWLGIYIQKCYAEGMKTDKIFKPPETPGGVNGK